MTIPCRSWSVSQASGDIEAILQTDQPLHRVGRRRVHADAAVPIHRHEPERRIDDFADDRQVQAMTLGDVPPVMDTGPAQRIDAQTDARAADRLHVDDLGEIVHISGPIVIPVCGARAQSLLEGHSLHALKAALQKFVRLRFDPVSDSGLRRPPCGGCT